MLDAKKSTAQIKSTDEVLDDIRRQLKDFRKSRPISVASAISALWPEILEAQRREGATAKDLALIFSACGLQTEADALRVALKRNATSKVARGHLRRRTPEADPLPGSAQGIAALQLGQSPPNSTTTSIDKAPELAQHLK